MFSAKAFFATGYEVTKIVATVGTAAVTAMGLLYVPIKIYVAVEHTMTNVAVLKTDMVEVKAGIEQIKDMLRTR
jgi:hypothetical protein